MLIVISIIENDIPIFHLQEGEEGKLFKSAKRRGEKKKEGGKGKKKEKMRGGKEKRRRIEKEKREEETKEGKK